MNTSFKHICHLLHLWLGLISGIVVIIVCLTGALFQFRDEIKEFTEPWRKVAPQNSPMLPPMQLVAIADKATGNTNPKAITIGEADKAVSVDYSDKEKGSCKVFMNPYSGNVIKIVEKSPEDFDFFRFLMAGHRRLWLPREIGKPIVGWGIAIFAITLLTGIVLWYPKKWNKKTAKRLFTVNKHRLNFDLHNVVGGYAAIFLLIIALTGLVWSFQWFSKSTYWLTSGGKELQPYTMPSSDTTAISSHCALPIDKLNAELRKENPDAAEFYIAFPQDSTSAIRVSIQQERAFSYNTDNLFFDQYTLKPLEGKGSYTGKYAEATTADKLRRMNFNIHDGSILGLPGKIIAFLCALIGASLPITGFIIWLKKRS